jgi:pyridoxine kinase
MAMPLALILSSYVAASRIGGGAQQYALAPFGIDPVLIPTVMLGANPAKGGRGAATDPELFRNLIDGVEGQGLLGLVDVVITGHFSLPEQVAMACEVIAKVGAADRSGAFAAQPIVVVDPVLGDAPKGLYVKPAVAEAVARDLVPLADWITPNLWELSFLSGRELGDAPSVVEAVRSLGRPALVTSVPVGEGEIALACCAPLAADLFIHPRVAQAPNGTGDLVTAIFAAGLVRGEAPAVAAERAARAVAEALDAAKAWNAPDLPLVALGERLVRPSAPVRIERLV